MGISGCGAQLRSSQGTCQLDTGVQTWRCCTEYQCGSSDWFSQSLALPALGEDSRLDEAFVLTQSLYPHFGPTLWLEGIASLVETVDVGTCAHTVVQFISLV